MKLTLLVLFFSLSCPLLYSSPEEELLLKYKNEIIEAANLVGVSPRIIASIIYTEQKLNVKLGENILDYIFAKSGYNVSIGIAQVKINTALWIEDQIDNRQGIFFLGEKVKSQISASLNREEIIEKLNFPKLNILYAACYISMIHKVWESIINISPGNINVGIIATIYSLGILDSENNLRKPHIDAKMNNFGKTAQEFYNSFTLRTDF